MRDTNPERYEKTMSVKMSEEEHRQIKMLAVQKKKTIKAILFEALDKAFPTWLCLRHCPCSRRW